MAGKIHTIYKEDKWNMISVQLDGSKITVREISTLWGEDTYTFHTRHELMEWVKGHYKAEDYVGREEVFQTITENFKQL